MDDARSRWTAVARGQGLYYLVTGLRPLISMRTFERITGPKADRWLVQTVGVLVSVIGADLLLAGRRRRCGPEVTLLASGSAAGLAALEVVHVARGRIAKIYLLDAVIEAALLYCWRKAGSGGDFTGDVDRG